MSLRSTLVAALFVTGCAGSPGAPAPASSGAPSTSPSNPAAPKPAVNADGPLTLLAEAGGNVDATLPANVTGLPTALNFTFGAPGTMWSLVVASKEIAEGKSFQVVPFDDKNSSPASGQANVLYQADASRYWRAESGTITFTKLGDFAKGGTVARFESVAFKPHMSKAQGTFTLNGTVTTVPFAP